MLCLDSFNFLFFKKREIWFYRGEDVLEGTYTVYCYTRDCFPLPYVRKYIEYTATVDLCRGEKELFSSFNRTFRYHIRKAAFSGITCRIKTAPTPKESKEVCTAYNRFAKAKGIPGIRESRIRALQKSGNMMITTSMLENRLIATHIYLYSHQIVLLLYSFHELNFSDSRMRGYANKFHHWKDMVTFKEMNFKIYDFGGINEVTVPGISKFKLSFGGKIEEVTSYIRLTPGLKPFFKMYEFFTVKLKRMV